jgi:hypothetical protein
MMVADGGSRSSTVRGSCRPGDAAVANVGSLQVRAIFGENAGPFEHMHQLPHVARPIVGQQAGRALRAQPFARRLLPHLIQEVFG